MNNMKKLTLIKNGKQRKIKCTDYRHFRDDNFQEVIEIFHYQFVGYEKIDITPPERILVSDYDNILFG